jgi:hypothetical protein
MNKLTISTVALCLVSASQATLFNTTLFTTSDSNGANPNLSPVFSVSGNTYSASLSNALIGSPVRTYLDITWWHEFDASVATAGSPAVPGGFSSVTQTLYGRVRRTDTSGNASFSASLTETILNGNGGFGGSSNPVFNYSGVVDTNWQTFNLSVTTPFNQALNTGTAQKDNLILNANQNVEVIIDQIDQKYLPVPEPVSMIALGIGGLSLLARRKKK